MELKTGALSIETYKLFNRIFHFFKLNMELKLHFFIKKDLEMKV